MNNKAIISDAEFTDIDEMLSLTESHILSQKEKKI